MRGSDSVDLSATRRSILNAMAQPPSATSGSPTRSGKTLVWITGRCSSSSPASARAARDGQARSAPSIVEFDWEERIPAIISDRSLFGEREWGAHPHFDRRPSRSASSPILRGQRFGETIPLPAKAVRGAECTRRHYDRLRHAPADDHGFDGLGLRCVIEQKMIDAWRRFSAALGGLRMRRRSSFPLPARRGARTAYLAELLDFVLEPRPARP